jgi:hypothetical protein
MSVSVSPRFPIADVIDIIIMQLNLYCWPYSHDGQNGKQVLFWDGIRILVPSVWVITLVYFSFLISVSLFDLLATTYGDIEEDSNHIPDENG